MTLSETPIMNNQIKNVIFNVQMLVDSFQNLSISAILYECYKICVRLYNTVNLSVIQYVLDCIALLT